MGPDHIRFHTCHNTLTTGPRAQHTVSELIINKTVVMCSCVRTKCVQTVRVSDNNLTVFLATLYGPRSLGNIRIQNHIRNKFPTPDIDIIDSLNK